MNPTRLCVGWDVGGAHLKAAFFDGTQIVDIAQWACPLWEGLDRLGRALDNARERWPAIEVADHAVTMTGEMCDLFEHREAGVHGLAAYMVNALRGDPMQFDVTPANIVFYGGQAGWFVLPQAGRQWRDIASANWRATAQCVASHCGSALLIDIGSTTTDLIPVRGGEVVASGHNDEGRLAAGELVYCGVVRTPLCVLARRISLGGRSFNVMNEWFATTADVYRLTGELDLGHDQHPTADGASKSHDATRQRLAHMVGHDARDASNAQWLEFAHAWRTEQLALIRANLDRVLARAGLPDDAPFIGAGCGHFLARDLAKQLGRPYLGFEACVPLAAGLEDWARVCAPSAAVAWLASAQAWSPQDEVMTQARFSCGS